MSNPLEKLLEQLGIENPGQLLNCRVEQDIARTRTLIDAVPSKEDSAKALTLFALAEMRRAGDIMVREARKRELELEIQMLDKPSDIDLGSEEWEHLVRHIELEQLQCELEKRKGQAFSRFCDLVEELSEDV